MGNLSLQEAYGIFGGKPANRLHSVSAMATSGAEMILSCAGSRFKHPARGILRYEDTLTRDTTRPTEMQLLGQHLTQARDQNLPVRMVVITETADAAGKTTRGIHVRADLVGKVVEFDGERYVVDFVRQAERVPGTARR
jgi:hypothetical protein